MKALATFLLLWTLTAVAGAQTSPEYLRHYNPTAGFKPAQTNLTEIFLQIAGSLEATGSPEGYIRHMQAEHKRVSALYARKTGKTYSSRMPSHMTDEYIEKYIRNWNTLSAPLKLDAFAREIGRCSREAILGTRTTGTLAVEIFNQHQAEVAKVMRGVSTTPAGYIQLRDRLQEGLEYGKENITMVGYETTRRDAVRYAFVIDGKFGEMFTHIESIAKPEKAAAIKQAVGSAFLELINLAQSELEIGILESAMKQL